MGKGLVRNGVGVILTWREGGIGIFLSFHLAIKHPLSPRQCEFT